MSDLSVEMREMSEEDDNRTFTVEIPWRFYDERDFIIPFLEALAKARSARESKPKETTDPARFLAKEIIELLRAESTDSKNTSPHGLVILVVQFVNKDRLDLAERTIEAAQADTEIARRMRKFFEKLPDGERPEPLDSWPDKLRKLLSKPHYNTLGKKAAAKISTRKKEGGINPQRDFYAILKRQVEKKVHSGMIPKAVYSLLTATIILAFGTSTALAWGFSVEGASQSGAAGAGRNSSFLRRKAMHWKVLTVIAIIAALALLGWCIPSDDETEQGDQASGVAPAQRDGTITLQEGAEAPLDATTDGNAEASYTADMDCAVLDHEYRKRACYLVLGESLAKANLEKALSTFTAGLRVPRWRDSSIPELASDKWQRSGGYVFELQEISFHQGISSVYCHRQQFMECRNAYRRAFDIKRALPQGQGFDLLMNTDECFVMMALERKTSGVQASARARSECVSNYPGDDSLPFHYESGLARAASGQDALAAEDFVRQLEWSHTIFPSTYRSKILDSWPGIVEDEKVVRQQSIRQLDAVIYRLAQQGQGLRLQDAWALIRDDQMFVLPFPSGSDKDGRCTIRGAQEWKITITSGAATREQFGVPIGIAVDERQAGVRIEAEQVTPLPCWTSSLRHAFCIKNGKLKANMACASP
jgi:hypothetical protein